MYKLKESPEDFVVKEVSSVEFSEGPYSYFILRKRDITTVDACRKIADAMYLKLNDIGFAGTKDKKAVTEQLISIRNVNREKVEKLVFGSFSLQFAGSGAKPVSLGDLKGNEFTITLRDVEKQPSPINFFVNYFDEQRFSSDNVSVGRFILKRDFKSAAELIAKSNDDVLRFIESKPNDYVNAVRVLPRKILSFYINAYQSFLWNEVACEFVRRKFSGTRECGYSLGVMAFSDERLDLKIPLVGFGTEFENDEIEGIYRAVLAREKIGLRDFIVRGIPELSSEGALRDLFADVGNLSIDMKGDVCVLHFFLQKGSYATVAVRSMFC